MRILITGGLGFIGSNIAKKYVNNGHNVTLLSKSNIKMGNINPFKDKVKLIFKDIRDIGSEEVSRQDIIFHAASTVDNYNIHSDPYLDTNINVIGTIALLEACRKFNHDANIVYTSTFFVNGNPDRLPVTPEVRPEPLGLYGATKLCAEHICKTYRNVYRLNIKIARLSNVFGDNEQFDNNKKAAFNHMIYSLVSKEKINLYDNGKIIRDYIYIDDVVDALTVIADKGGNEIYYVSRGEGIQFRKLIDIIMEETGTDNNLVNIINPSLFHNQVGIDDFYCDISPLRKLGWEPKISLREGIKKVITQYRMYICNA